MSTHLPPYQSSAWPLSPSPLFILFCIIPLQRIYPDWIHYVYICLLTVSTSWNGNSMRAGPLFGHKTSNWWMNKLLGVSIYPSVKSCFSRLDKLCSLRMIGTFLHFSHTGWRGNSFASGMLSILYPLICIITTSKSHISSCFMDNKMVCSLKSFIHSTNICSAYIWATLMLCKDSWNLRVLGPSFSHFPWAYCALEVRGLPLLSPGWKTSVGFFSEGPS